MPGKTAKVSGKSLSAFQLRNGSFARELFCYLAGLYGRVTRIGCPLCASLIMQATPR